MSEQVTAAIEEITPKQASDILALQDQLGGDLVQRPINRNTVAAYAREMAAGKWHLNGEAIQFNGGERLLNGQHRLRAIVEADMTVPLLVVRGVSLDAFASIDQGKNRSIGDLLRIRQLPYRAEVAAGARCALVYEAMGDLMTSTYRPTRPEVLAYILEHQDALTEASALAVSCNLAHRSCLTTLAFLARHRQERSAFFGQLRDGIGLVADAPAHHLRERLLHTVGERYREHVYVTFAWAVKAWNAAVRQTPIARLRFAENEDYPVMVR